MGLTVESLDELDATLVAQAQAELMQLIAERHPEADLSDGVLHDLVGYLAGGISGGINQTNVNRVQQSNSLLDIENNPQLAEPTIVDGVLSNLLVTRKPGSNATGEITIVVTDNAAVVIPANSIYVANGAAFVADAPFIGRPAGVVLQGPNERTLNPRGDGTYEFTITATASQPGVAGNIRRGSLMTPQTPIGRYVTSFAATDFSGGTDTELNADLLKRLQEGPAAPVMQGRVNISSLLHEQEAFTDTVNYSIIGMSNPEMQRDQHGIIPMSGGGRVDIYARTRQLPQNITLRKTAVLVEKLAAGSVWQAAVERDDAPGFYEVTQVLRPLDSVDMAGFEVTMDVRGFDLSGTGVLPDVIDANEAAYTRFQTAVVRFLDTDTDVTNINIGDTADYLIVVGCMPLVADLQTFCSDYKIRNLMGDVLVKAAVPCFLSINFDIEQAAGETAPDVDAIKNEIATLVNTMDFPGQLHVSMIANLVQRQLTSRQALGPIDMLGRIRRPDGQNVYVRSSQTLTIPDSPAKMVTGRTTALICDPQNIGLTVVTKGFEVSA